MNLINPLQSPRILLGITASITLFFRPLYKSSLSVRPFLKGKLVFIEKVLQKFQSSSKHVKQSLRKTARKDQRHSFQMRSQIVLFPLRGLNQVKARS